MGRSVVLFLSFLWIGVFGAIQSSVASELAQPNIVFILVDDLGRHQLSCYDDSFYETPHIDRLVEEGMRFDNAYAAAAICSPTRASIMTGKYPARLHLTDFIPGGRTTNRKLQTPEWSKGLPVEETTVAEALKAAGYATGHFGKWHLNRDKKYELGRDGDPGSQGFDDVLTTHKPKAGPASPYEEDWHHVRQITERSLAFIEKHRDQPFFCFVTHNSIHDPEIEKRQLIDKYAEKAGAQKNGLKNPKQAAMLETLDMSIGVIMDRLRALDLEQDTVVVFFSDNGQLGPKNGKPFRGSKADLYEGGIRMPLIVRWPGIVAAGSVCEEIVISNDFFPTFCELAGGGNVVSQAKVDGCSLLPLLREPASSLARDSVCWHYPHYHGRGLGPQGAIRRGRYKLIEWFEKSVMGEAGAFELYDLEKDPGEQNNLAISMPDLSGELARSLQQWRIEVGAQMMTVSDGAER